MTLSEKWPELARELLPAVKRIGYLWNPNDARSTVSFSQARRSTEALGLEFGSYPVERPENLDSAFAAMMGDGVSVLSMCEGSCSSMVNTRFGHRAPRVVRAEDRVRAAEEVVGVELLGALHHRDADEEVGDGRRLVLEDVGLGDPRVPRREISGGMLHPAA